MKAIYAIAILCSLFVLALGAPQATPSPDVSPVISPDVSPAVSASPSPAASIDPSPSPAASIDPSPSPAASVDPSPSPAASPDASPSPAASPDASPSPAASPDVTPSPEISPEVTPSPATSPEVSPTPEVSPEVSPSPAASPEVSPEVSPSPAASPEVSPSPVPSASPAPGASPAPWTRDSTCSVQANGVCQNVVSIPAGAGGAITVQIQQLATNNSVDLCVSSAILPAGSNLASTCPAGGFATVAGGGNAAPTRKSATATGPAAQATIYLPNSPIGTIYNVVSYVADNSAQDYTITFSGSSCSDTEVFTGTSCSDISIVDAGASNMTIAGNSTNYFVFTTNEDNRNNITFTLTNLMSTKSNPLKFWIGYGFVPSGQAATYTKNTTSNNVYSKTVYTSGDDNDNWYIVITNTLTTDVNYTFTATVNACNDSNTFGLYCNRTQGASIITLETNMTSSLPFQLNAAADLDYYSVAAQDFPENSDYLRVSVAAADKDKPAPSLLARANAIPTLSAFDYNITSGDYANQVFLSNSLDSVWYIAVMGAKSQRYAIWTNVNCANNCTSRAECVCDGVTCGVSNLYTLPTTVDDSYGVCPCDSDYTLYDCSEDDGHGWWYYIVIGIIILALVALVAVAIAVPVYIYIQKRKRNQYQQV